MEGLVVILKIRITTSARAAAIVEPDLHPNPAAGFGLSFQKRSASQGHSRGASVVGPRAAAKSEALSWNGHRKERSYV